MLTDGLHHVAILTNDTRRFTAFYQGVFDATIDASDRDGLEGKVCVPNPTRPC